MEANDKSRQQSMELVAGIYSGLSFLQLLLWGIHFAKQRASTDASLEKGMRWYKEQADRGLAQGFEGRINEQTIEQVARLRQLLAEWAQTGDLSPEMEELALRCLKDLLGKEGLLRLPGLPWEASESL
jgi:hypothetical protein